MAYMMGATQNDQAHPSATQPLFLSLSNGLSAQERTDAGRLLFLASITHPDDIDVMRSTLEELATRRQPHVRVAAGRARHLLEISELLRDVDRGTRTSEEAQESLHQLLTLSLAGPDHRWAAETAMTWLKTAARP